MDFISHKNNGWGLFNLDLNSGWACVATKYLSSGNSINSNFINEKDYQLL